MTAASTRPVAAQNPAAVHINGAVVDAEYIARYLGGACRNGGGWMARCPAHDDHNPSLSITDADEDGKVLVKCHAGCSQNEVIRALDLRGLWPRWQSKHRVTAPPIDINDVRRALKRKYPGRAPEKELRVEGDGAKRKRIIAKYNYQDEEGKLLFQVVRFVPKDFRQRRPDGNGGWTWKLGDARRVLYHLPKVLKAKVVYVVEGEKDVATLERLGRTATCNSGGAGKWKAEYSACLRGKQVVVIPDNDEPGRDHAEKVARSVRDAGAAWVKVVALPEGKDVSEWVEDHGGTRAKLIALVKAASRYRPPAQESDGAQSIRSVDDVRSIFTFADAEVEWDVDEIILSHSVTIIAAESGSGKSTLVSALCDRVSRGEEFAGLATRKRPVLVLDRENPLFAVRERFERLHIRDGETFKIWGGWELEESPAPLSPRVVEWVKACDPKPLIVVDSLKAFAQGDENNASEMHAVMAQFRGLANLGATVVVLHNRSEKTEGNYRGSTVIKQDADVGFTLTNVGIDGKLGSLRLTPFKARVLVSAMAFQYTEENGFVEDESVARPVRDSAKLRDLLIDHPRTTTEQFVRLALENDLRQKHARRFLEQGVLKGEIERSRGLKNTRYFTWVGDANSDA